MNLEEKEFIMQRMTQSLDNRQMIMLMDTLDDENYIYKSPIRRIHKVKETISIKDTYADRTGSKIIGSRGY